ncbi:hypothetical protein [Calothrix sp. UHCC 0171]|uniref:hypothetical protein n=1 Tax=Calothrix sp. UHCC 0171 TaxID=3110245 RepID=UPI002B20DAC4|nr:hypothetical protein [Calothrix sp. UHCC 0171]MEA5571038.1 hypothetical protein [Calothrix sp. UHCC 0171]
MKRSNIWQFSHHLRRAGTLILAQPKRTDVCIKIQAFATRISGYGTYPEFFIALT